jgi:hypothetical protein
MATLLGHLAHALHGGGGRPDEGQPVLFAEGREARVLGEEAPPWMDRCAAGLPGGLDDGRHPQVALGGRGATDADHLVELFGPRGALIGGGHDADSADSGVAGGPRDAHGDLSAVRDE